MREEAQRGVGAVHRVVAHLAGRCSSARGRKPTSQLELGDLDVAQRVAGADLPNGVHEGEHRQQTRAARVQRVQRLHVVRSAVHASPQRYSSSVTRSFRSSTIFW